MCEMEWHNDSFAHRRQITMPGCQPRWRACMCSRRMRQVTREICIELLVGAAAKVPAHTQFHDKPAASTSAEKFSCLCFSFVSSPLDKEAPLTTELERKRKLFLHFNVCHHSMLSCFLAKETKTSACWKSDWHCMRSWKVENDAAMPVTSQGVEVSSSISIVFLKFC